MIIFGMIHSEEKKTGSSPAEEQKNGTEPSLSLLSEDDHEEEEEEEDEEYLAAVAIYEEEQEKAYLAAEEEQERAYLFRQTEEEEEYEEEEEEKRAYLFRQTEEEEDFSYFDVYEALEDCKSSYDQFWDMKEEEARLEKEKWYSAEWDKLPMVMEIIVTVTVIHSPFIAGLIADFMHPIHPDDMKEEEDRLKKDAWYSAEWNKLPMAMGIIVTVTVIYSPFLAGIIIEYMYPIHPDDMDEWCAEEWYVEEEPKDTYESPRVTYLDPKLHWSRKGFGDKESYDAAVKAATKKWHRTLSLTKRWGGKWRRKRHEKAFAAVIALTWP
jgi:hypothetical protein